MKSWEFDAFGFDRLKLVDKTEPNPGLGQVLVDMAAWSLNYRDIMMVTGQYNPRLPLPFTPLSDGAGTIVEVGPGVKDWKKGQRVAGCFMSGWREGALDDAKAGTALGGALPGVATSRVLFDEGGIVEIPEHLSFEEAATLPCAGVTAWQSLVTFGRVTAGEQVLIQGTGGVSLFALQFAKMHGATVLATTSQAEKAQRLTALGAAKVVNYRDVPEWGKEIARLSGRGVDLVVEVGGAGTLPQSFRAVRTGGKIALIGVLANDAAGVNPIPVLMKAIAVQGIFVGSREMFREMNRAIAATRMMPIIDRVFRFDELPAALAYQQSGKHFGKVCLKK